MENYVFGRPISRWHPFDISKISFIIAHDGSLQYKCSYDIVKCNDKVMSLEVAAEAIDYFVKNQRELFSNRYIILEFICEEPLSKLDLIENIVDYFKVHIYLKHSTWFGRYRISIVTNGDLYSSKQMQKFVMMNSKTLLMEICMGPVKYIHDLQIVNSDNTKELVESERNAILCIKQYPEAIIKIKVGREDLSYLKESIIYLWNLGLLYLSVDMNLNEANEEDCEIFESQLMAIADYILDNRLWDRYNTTLFDESIGLKQINEDGSFKSNIKDDDYVIDTDGRVYPNIKYVGNISKSSEVIDYGDIYKGVRREQIRSSMIFAEKMQNYSENSMFDDCVHKSDVGMYENEGIYKVLVKVNNYYWAKLYNKYDIDRREARYKLYMDFEKHMNFMLSSNCVRLCANYALDTDISAMNNVSITNDIVVNKEISMANDIVMNKEIFMANDIVMNKEISITNDIVINKEISMANDIFMTKEILLEGLHIAKNEFRQPVFLYGSYKDIENVFEVFNIHNELECHMIKHIIPFNRYFINKITRYVKKNDLTVVIDEKSIRDIEDIGIKNCILIIREKEICDLFNWVEKLLPIFSRIDLKCEVFSFDSLALYSEQIARLSDLLETKRKLNKACKINILNGAVKLNSMKNCFAGEKDITIAPNGKRYICPAFYFEKEKFENIYETDNPEENKTLKLVNAPVCKTCDVYQCARCVYLNKKYTSKYNMPSQMQCMKSNKEHEIIIKLNRELEKPRW